MALPVALAAGGPGGCGKVGPPVPPEMVGLGAKIQREKDKERARAEEEKRRREIEEMVEKEAGPAKLPAAVELPQVPDMPEAAETPEVPESPEEQEVELPPLRPIGTPR